MNCKYNIKSIQLIFPVWFSRTDLSNFGVNIYRLMSNEFWRDPMVIVWRKNVPYGLPYGHQPYLRREPMFVYFGDISPCKVVNSFLIAISYNEPLLKSWNMWNLLVTLPLISFDFTDEEKVFLLAKYKQFYFYTTGLFESGGRHFLNEIAGKITLGWQAKLHANFRYIHLLSQVHVM